MSIGGGASTALAEEITWSLKGSLKILRNKVGNLPLNRGLKVRGTFYNKEKAKCENKSTECESHRICGYCMTSRLI